MCTLPPGVGGASGSAGAGGASAGAGGTAGTAGAGGGPTQCTSDADCAGTKLGYCENGRPFASACLSGCLQDSDCNSGLCICDGSAHGGKCYASNCHTDTDCGAQSFCSLVQLPCSGGAYQCLQQGDQCWSPQDGTQPAYCSLEATTRSCSNAVCGRPFLIEETARLADVNARRDWLAADVRPDLLGQNALERAERAAHWSRLGQMEHASIAAFARFNLQLLSLGAPAELLEGCNRAWSTKRAMPGCASLWPANMAAFRSARARSTCRIASRAPISPR